MTTNEQKLAAKMLRLASQVFGNHGCNDVAESEYNGWTIEERRAFNKEFHEWNGDPEEYMEDHLHLPDFAIMSFLADKLEDAVKQDAELIRAIDKLIAAHTNSTKYSDSSTLSIAYRSFASDLKELKTRMAAQAAE